MQTMIQTEAYKIQTQFNAITDYLINLSNWLQINKLYCIWASVKCAFDRRYRTIINGDPRRVRRMKRAVLWPGDVPLSRRGAWERLAPGHWLRIVIALVSHAPQRVEVRRWPSGRQSWAVLWSKSIIRHYCVIVYLKIFIRHCKNSRHNETNRIK